MTLREALSSSIEIEEARERTTWRPIETAPRDGTEILAYSAIGCTDVMLVRFTSMAEFLTDSEVDAYIDAGADADMIEQSDWFFADFVHGDRLSPDCYPTHWMPLPKPPEPPGEISLADGRKTAG